MKINWLEYLNHNRIMIKEITVNGEKIPDCELADLSQTVQRKIKAQEVIFRDVIGETLYEIKD